MSTHFDWKPSAVAVSETSRNVALNAARTLARGLGEWLGASVPVTQGTPPPGSVWLGTVGDAVAAGLAGWTTGLEALGDEGYALKCVGAHDDGGPRFAVIANTPRGCLYGGATFLEDVKLRRVGWNGSDRMEKPAHAERAVWTWSRPSSDEGAYFRFDDMIRLDSPAPGPREALRFREWAELLVAMRINTVCFWGKYGEGKADGEPLACDAYRALIAYLKDEYDIGTRLFVKYQVDAREWDNLYDEPYPGDMNGLCPHDARVRRAWSDRIENLYRLFPKLEGLILAGAVGDWLRGPTECPCERCQSRTPRERVLMGIHMIAAPLAQHGGRLTYKNVTDRPTRVDQEVALFARLDGLIPENVTIAFKNFYNDFRPAYPDNPMFYHLEPPLGEASPYVAEFQVFGEYRGGRAMPSVMARKWEGQFRRVAKAKLRGALAVASNDRPDIDHPINRANWYAFGRFAWNPMEDAEAILRDWAALQYGMDAAPYMAKIAELSYKAALGMMFTLGIRNDDHSKLPTINMMLESSFVGPWHDIPRAEGGFVGHGNDVSMYPPVVAEAIKSDPDIPLFANRIPLTAELVERAIADKDEAVEAWRLAIGVLEEARPHLERATYESLKEDFRRYVNDAKLFRESVALYLTYKLGTLTPKHLEERLERLDREIGPEGGTENTSGKLYHSFVGEWRQVLGGTFKRRVMEGIHWTPPQPDFPPGFSRKG